MIPSIYLILSPIDQPHSQSVLISAPQNFIFYFGNVFFKSLGTIQNPFLISLVTSLVNCLTTPLAFWTVERFGRRTILIIGASCMVTFQFIVGIIGVTAGQESKHNNPAVSAMIACTYLLFTLPPLQIPKVPIQPIILIPSSHLPQHRRLRHHLGSRRLGRSRRNLSPPNPFPRCWSLHRLQLVLELHHRCHHPLSRWNPERRCESWC